MNTGSPRTFSMTLGTARDMVAAPDNYRAEKVAEARRVVAYWQRRRAAARHFYAVMVEPAAWFSTSVRAGSIEAAKAALLRRYPHARVHSITA
jgi:hypothetical protein